MTTVLEVRDLSVIYPARGGQGEGGDLDLEAQQRHQPCRHGGANVGAHDDADGLGE